MLGGKDKTRDGAETRLGGADRGHRREALMLELGLEEGMV